jgi:hypothetical protein
MSEEYDGPWKEAIDDALAPCLALFYPDSNRVTRPLESGGMRRGALGGG